MKIFVQFFILMALHTMSQAVNLEVGGNSLHINVVNVAGLTLRNATVELVKFEKNRVTLKASSNGYQDKTQDLKLSPGKKKYFFRIELADPEFQLDLRDLQGNKVKYVVDLDQSDVNFREKYVILLTLLEDGFENFTFFEVGLTLNDLEPKGEIVKVGSYLGYRQILIALERKTLDSSLNVLDIKIPHDRQKSQRDRFQDLYQSKPKITTY